MTMDPSATFTSVDLADPEFAELLEELSTRLQSDRPVDLAEYVDRFPQFAGQLEQLVPAMQGLWGLGELTQLREPTSNEGQVSEPAREKQLGDFRLVREIGRGGMGVVYEAEQISLGRRVALKVLPFAGMLDQRQLQRFQNEARAAATLHHPHIVPIYFVGNERGVHFYAMQLIEGRTVAELIQEWRHEWGDSSPTEPEAKRYDLSPDRATPANRRSPLEVGNRSEAASSPDMAAGSHDLANPAQAETRTTARDRTNEVGGGTFSSTDSQTRDETFRASARLIAQAAEALDYAHAQGVVHRDVKPGNLLLDRSGDVWISDFGLARLEGEAGVTMTGDLLGTLRVHES